VLPLSRIIASKKAAGRPKDHAILPVLEDTLAVLRSRETPRRRPARSRAGRRNTKRSASDDSGEKSGR